MVNERNEGWNAAMEGADGFTDLGAQTANWSTEEAKSVFETVLKSNGNDVQLVFAQNDEMGLGAAQAVEEAGLVPGEDVKIATIDGTQAALEALAAGTLSFVAEYNPLFGEQALEAVNTVLDGGDVESYIQIESTTFDSPRRRRCAARPQVLSGSAPAREPACRDRPADGRGGRSKRRRRRPPAPATRPTPPSTHTGPRRPENARRGTDASHHPRRAQDISISFPASRRWTG